MSTANPQPFSISLHKLMTFLMPVFMAVAGYFFTSVFGQIADHDQRIRTIELAAATTAGNRFTSVDWTTARADLDQRHNIIDQRVTRLEETNLAIKEMLARIEKKLDRLEERAQ
jgi:hypothetical protein